jgi:hypothetical protein
MNNQENQNNQNNDWAKRDIGALWKKEGKTQKYLSGYFKLESGEEVKVVVFSNKNKKDNQKAPDYRVYLSKQKEGEEIKNISPKIESKPKPKAYQQKPQTKSQVEPLEEDLL